MLRILEACKGCVVGVNGTLPAALPHLDSCLRGNDIEGIYALTPEHDKPGRLYIHTRLPVYGKQNRAREQNPETMKKFIEQSDFYCRLLR